MSGLPDDEARQRARTALSETVFVNAGAGAGKTSVLVGRICQMVLDPVAPVPMRAVAAVTFTEKAAAHLRDRVRAELSRAAEDADRQVAVSAEAALAELDMAAIGTLHAFAGRLLMENPIEAGLPPVIEVLDEVASGVWAGRWWTKVRSELIEEDATWRAMSLLLTAGLSWKSIRAVSQKLNNDWDRIEGALPEPPPVQLSLWPDLAPLDAALTALRRRIDDECLDRSDKLADYPGRFEQWLAPVRHAPDEMTAWQMLRTGRPRKPGRTGRESSWVDCQSIRDEIVAVYDVADEVRAQQVDRAVTTVIAAMARHVLAAAQQRRREGALQFHDLLVLTRDMLRRSGSARTAAQARYRRILLDEFQDTDPLQIEIAVRIAAGAAGGLTRWQDCPVPPGALFVVGDPKQSVYRFRRADIAMFMAAEQVLGQGRTAELTTNFRSHPGILDWINRTFARLIVAETGGQPPYLPLDADPARLAGATVGPADGPRVTVLGLDPVPATTAEELSLIEADLVAEAIAELIREAPAIEERGPDGWRTRALRPADICILVPARTSLRFLEAALNRLNVPFRTEASSLVLRSDEVRDLLLTARAIDDPSDKLALVEALRTPLFGCGDDDLVTWRAAGGRFSMFAPRPEGLAENHPVAESLAYLSQLARKRSALAPSQLLAAIVIDRRAFEAAADGPGTREVWHRLRFVIDQARAWSESERGTLRDFLDWAALQAEQEERASEIVLPERDVDAIRILTIHAAKGLEFPVVVLSGMTSGMPTDVGPLVWPDSGPPEAALGKDARSAGWTRAKVRERHLLHLERLRLLYVAATRAESRLVVSLVRKAEDPTRECAPEDQPRAQLLAEASFGAPHRAWSPPEGGVPALPLVDRPVAAPMAWENWVAIRDAARAAAKQREADSATDIAHGDVPAPPGLELPPGLVKEPRDLELPAWLKGRYGVAVGRAVHGTLQTVDLATGSGLDGIAEAQAIAEGVADRADAVRALARAGWESPTVRAAAAREHHKETYVGAQIGGQLVEGYIDLLHRDDDGSLVIIDYKTDAAPRPEVVQAYQRQLAVYAAALAEATGQRVSRCVLVLCREGGAFELDVPLPA